MVENCCESGLSWALRGAVHYQVTSSCDVLVCAASVTRFLTEVSRILLLVYRLFAVSNSPRLILRVLGCVVSRFTESVSRSAQAGVSPVEVLLDSDPGPTHPAAAAHSHCETAAATPGGADRRRFGRR